jgi:putative ABC transport system substrate-binding protein
MRRREFITLLGGATVAWPLSAHTQQVERVRRIGILLGLTANDPLGKNAIAVILHELQQLGWTNGRNMQIESRWAGGDAEDLRKHASELVTLAPDVLIATGGTSVGPLLQATRIVPIVFANVPDPVGSGFVESLSHPGGNATGFVQFEYNLSGKWLELLKQIAPGVRRVAVLWDPAVIAGVGQLAVIQSVAPSQGLEVLAINVRDAAEIERVVAGFANFSDGGIVVTASALALTHRDRIVTIAARYKLPTVYFQRRGRRIDLLWSRFPRPVSSRCRLC